MCERGLRRSSRSGGRCGRTGEPREDAAGAVAMRILIVGAGALGGGGGAYLTRAGEDVTLLEVNQARARLLADAGLHITRVGQGETTIPIRVVTSLTGVDPFDLVFVAVKTYQTGDAVRAALGASKATTLFFSLKALGKNRPSMWQALARGTRTEIDALNGAIVREGERLGLPVPHNTALVHFIHSRARQKFLREPEMGA